ncbi:amidase signature domain-containing protein [Lentinula boryana]|uniref:Amidase signature domain-containing protein n=1 Tax=Lentinula boryana TaxID=40481 RepID=A0ABQ8Q005_9AGAR|nr:amidase signature domain-containing protein [Lentinula boryana]
MEPRNSYARSNPISNYDLLKVLDKLERKLKPQEEPDYLVLPIPPQLEILFDFRASDYEPTSSIERFSRKNVNYQRIHMVYGRGNIQDTKLNNGPLSGKKIVIKDNIAVSGVDCLLGTSMFTGWKPTTDATVVTRILEAGGTITGKAVGYFTGGSSSGCGLLIASREADIALKGMGGDQGESVRIPASWCGLFETMWAQAYIRSGTLYTGIAPLG